MSNDPGDTAAQASGAVDETTRRRLGAVAGLDAAVGLRHLRSRWDSYARVLKKFAETRATDIETMKSHLAARDYAALSDLMHNVKGVAGFLGAVELQEMATALCSAVREGRDAVEIERIAGAIIESQSELSAGVLAVLGQLPEARGA